MYRYNIIQLKLPKLSVDAIVFKKYSKLRKFEFFTQLSIVFETPITTC